uniref:SPATA6 domain-containing protein n=1 Tax=Strongyloides papillosus TaxID=174720 RepID=A0A0N5BIY6_STREA
MEGHGDSSEDIPTVTQGARTRAQGSRGKLVKSSNFGSYYLFTKPENGTNYAGRISMKSKLNWKLVMIHEKASVLVSLGCSHNIIKIASYFYLQKYVCMTPRLCGDTLGDIQKRLEVFNGFPYRYVLKRDGRGFSCPLKKSGDSQRYTTRKHQDSAMKIMKLSGTTKCSALGP